MHTAKYAIHPYNTCVPVSILSLPCYFKHTMFWVRSRRKCEPLDISEVRGNVQRWCHLVDDSPRDLKYNTDLGNAKPYTVIS
jgi:hypothetical protein